MYLDRKTIRKFHQLAKSEEFGYIFDRMVEEPPVPTETLKRLAEVFAEELSLSTDEDIDKLAYIMYIATLACKEKQENE
jgi:hypothetical protein